MALINGKLLSSQLGTVPGTNYVVYKPLVTQVFALRQAFAKRFGKPLMITGDYRTYDEQVGLFTSRYTTAYLAGRPWKVWNNVRWYQKPYTAMAAVPGRSNHGYGTAIDFGSNVNNGGSIEWQWMVKNAPNFGLRWPSEWAKDAREWWHFEDGIVVKAENYTPYPGVDITVIPGNLPNPLEPEMLQPDERNMLFHIGQYITEIPARTTEQVWAKPVSRVVDEPTTALQDMVDGTTASLETQIALNVLRAEITALTAVIGTLASEKGLDLDALNTLIAQAVKEAIGSVNVSVALTTE